MTKYKIPDGMVKEALNEFFKAASLNGLSAPLTDGQRLLYALEAALRWMAENPIVPTDEQALALYHFAYKYPGKNYGKYPSTYEGYAQCITEEWQRRMFLESEPEVPEEIKEVADEMLRNALGEQAERLALIDGSQRDLGGWGRKAIIRHLSKVYEAGLQKGKESK